MIGIVPLSEALAQAQAAGLDLVEFSQAEFPLCKILNYSKYKYELKKKTQQAKKKVKRVVVKEIKLRPNIAHGDLAVKVKKIKEFISEGHKVKISLMFRGREIVHVDIGKELLNNLVEMCTPESKVESAAKMEGRNIIMMLGPNLVKTT